MLVELVGGPKDGERMEMSSTPHRILFPFVANEPEVPYLKDTDPIPRLDYRYAQYQFDGKSRYFYHSER